MGFFFFFELKNKIKFSRQIRKIIDYFSGVYGNTSTNLTCGPSPVSRVSLVLLLKYDFDIFDREKDLSDHAVVTDIDVDDGRFIEIPSRDPRQYN